MQKSRSVGRSHKNIRKKALKREKIHILKRFFKFKKIAFNGIINQKLIRLEFITNSITERRMHKMRRSGPKYKVKESEQKKIAKYYLTKDISQKELAEQYGVSVTAIRSYINRYKEEVS